MDRTELPIDDRAHHALGRPREHCVRSEAHASSTKPHAAELPIGNTVIAMYEKRFPNRACAG